MAFGISTLASYANFTLIIFWVAMGLMVWFYFFRQAKWRFRSVIQPTLMMGTVALLYLALIAVPIYKMNSTNEFRFWSSKGFYQDTIYPLIEYSRTDSPLLPGNSHLIALFVFLVIAGNVIYWFIRLKNSGYSTRMISHPVFVTTSVLVLTAFINIAQCKILHTPNLHGRTALFFYPLFITVLVPFMGIIPVAKPRLVSMAVGLYFAFAGLFNLANGFRLNWVRDNWFDVNTFDVINYLNDYSAKKPVSLKTSWFFYHSFDYYRYTGKIPWIDLKDYDVSVNLNTDADYYYVFAEDYGKVKSQYEVVYKPDPERWLLKRKVNR